MAVVVAAAPPPMTAEEAFRQAEAEGLTLLLKEGTTTGYKNVRYAPRSKNKPYHAHVLRGGRQVFLGCFTTAGEAALRVARALEERAATSALCIARLPVGRAASRKRRLAEVDGGEADAIMVGAHELMDSEAVATGRGVRILASWRP